MKHLLLSAAVAATSLSLAGQAAASCVAAPAIQNGATVTCTGDAPTGFNQDVVNSGANLDDITLTVQPGATVSGTGEDAVKVDDGLTLVNDGTISGLGADDDGIDADDDADIQNNGTISATNKAVDAGNGLILVNDGTITSLNEGVEAGGDAYIENNGTIVATEKGVDAGNGLDLVNDGIIRSLLNEGIEADDDAYIENLGTVEGFDDALQVGENAIIVNFGRIENTQTVADLADPTVEAQDAIDIDSGEIINMTGGVIRSTTNAAIDYDPSTIAVSTVTNMGEISGTVAIETDPANDKSQEIANFGLIAGTSGLALNLGGGDDSYTQFEGGMIVGGADFGSGDDTMTLIGSFDGLIGGQGAIFDGGEDEDTFEVADYAFSDVAATLLGSVLKLGFDDGKSAFSLRLVNWEFFDFGGDVRSYAEIAAGATVIPLPGSLALLLGGLGGLGVLRRRRRAG